MAKPAGPQSPRSGALIGRWRLLERAGRGSFGTVFRAELTAEPSIKAAFKVARAPDDPRFAREAHLLATARSPHLPRLLDQGEWRSPEGLSYPYVVMQWVEGVPLYAVRNVRALTNAFAARALCHVAKALAELHALSGVHRDVKGDNVLVGSEGDAVLVDLGAAWHSEASSLTDTSIPPGTEAYRSPELLRFRRRFRRSPEARYPSHPADDVYALGVMAYRLVTGTYPAPLTDADTSSADPRPFLLPSDLASVHPKLEQLILQMLSEDRDKRGTAAELAQALEEVALSAGQEPIQESPSVAETQKTERPGPRRRFKLPSWLTWASGAATVGGLLLLVSLTLHRPHLPPKWGAEDWEGRPPSFTPDGGVGEEAFAGVQDLLPRAGPFILSLGRPMPSKPFPGQRRPPCIRGEREIIGACWLGPIKGEKPPCGNQMFDYEGECYFASFDGGRQPTSEQP